MVNMAYKERIQDKWTGFFFLCLTLLKGDKVIEFR